MAKKQASISVRHALTDEEIRFVRVYTAFNYTNVSEAYRRSHLVSNPDGDWFMRDAKGEPRLDKPMDARACHKCGTALLRLEHIQSYLAELRGSPGEQARTTLTDAALFGDDSLALKAAEKVLQEEDKLGFRDSVEWWAEVMCSIGAEVVLKVGDAEVVVPMKAMFPRFHDSLPPLDVIEKTLRTLEVYRDARKERDASAGEIS